MLFVMEAGLQHSVNVENLETLEKHFSIPQIPKYFNVNYYKIGRIWLSARPVLISCNDHETSRNEEKSVF